MVPRPVFFAAAGRTARPVCGPHCPVAGRSREVESRVVDGNRDRPMPGTCAAEARRTMSNRLCVVFAFCALAACASAPSLGDDDGSGAPPPELAGTYALHSDYDFATSLPGT